MKLTTASIERNGILLYSGIECYVDEKKGAVTHGFFTDFNSELLVNDHVKIKFADGNIIIAFVNKLNPLGTNGTNEAHFKLLNL
jgi:hypothetical protein